MFWFLLTLIGQFAGEWREPLFVGHWAIATDGRVTDATPRPTDGPPLIQRRKAEYKAAYDAAERDGKAVYRSDGLIGQPLPKGLYELILHKGEVWFIEVAPAGVPIPKPDRTSKDSLQVENCLT